MDFLKKARRDKGLTQVEMAKKMEMSRGGYAKLEIGSNKLTLARFMQICKVLELDVAVAVKEVQRNGNY